MTKPITHRALMKSGPKPKPIPVDATDRIRALAADGFSIVGVAARMGVSRNTFSGWLEADPDLQEAFDAGREQERYSLHNFLYRQAMEHGNASAAMFLLKARHGYREGDQSLQAGGVTVNIALPGSMTLQQFTAMTEGKTK